MDIVSIKVRSKMMSGIRRSGNKSTELHLVNIFRKTEISGWRRNFKLYGNPDFVFSKLRIAVFTHGCFWHCHGCHLFKWPQTRAEFWKTKIMKNVKRDKTVLSRLKSENWRILIVWECAMKGKGRLKSEKLQNKILLWMNSKSKIATVKGALIK